MKRTKQMNCSGIYQIYSILTCGVYLGSTSNFTIRKQQHFLDLKLNRHCNPKLQHHYNKYGKDDLVFSIIEVCSKKRLIEREQFYIDTKHPSFNLCIISCTSALGLKRSEEFKENRRGENNPSKRPEVIQKILKTKKENGWFEEMGRQRKEFWKSDEGKILKERQSKTFSGINNPQFGKNHSGINNPAFGTHHSKESIQKTKEGHEVWLETDEGKAVRQRRSEAMSGKNNPNYKNNNIMRKETQEILLTNQYLQTIL